MDKLLIITGPTATGKTALALELAKKFNGELISVDSRQVYVGMDIGTGKDVGDHPFQKIDHLQSKNLTYGFYDLDGISLWGLDIVTPNYQFNVSDFLVYAQTVIEDIRMRKKLPILVGGTALYIKSFLFPPETASVPQNLVLRNELEQLTLEDLREKLQEVDSKKWQKMNESDQKNPRRLLRAIEVALSKNGIENTTLATSSFNDSLLIGLNAPLEVLKERVNKRVESRLREGIDEERNKLFAKGYRLSLPSMSALGYDPNQSSQEWAKEEVAYAKRQMTFLKKLFLESEAVGLATCWFDITDPFWQQEALEHVKKWYSKSNGTEETKASKR